MVGYAWGPCGDDGGCTAVAMSVTWTDDPKAPVRMKLTYGSNPPQMMSNPSLDPRRYEDVVISGPLPARPRNLPGPYLLVHRGDTFAGLTSRLTDSQCPEDAPDMEKARQTAAVRAAVRKLNPKLDLAHLRAGDRLIVPDEEKMFDLLYPSK